MDANKVVKFLAASGAAGAAALLLLPAPGHGWSLLGGGLRLTQRDVRVFNNFTDPESNGNQQHDPSFPGPTGAVLAIWKAAVEWGSEVHGDGFGDPSQGTLGSGGANFDFSWQGLALSVGGPSDNIVSQIDGGGPGVFAFTELPIHDGWRIRFIQHAAIWEDGPGPYYPNGERDIQGVAAHELGHALGLGHSNDLSATMVSFLVGPGIDFRSIEADDVAGLHAIYGARSPAKPHVQTYEFSGGLLAIDGSGFAPGANEVWFTRATPTQAGEPLKIGGLRSSADGTLIQLPVPPEAGQGDLLVRIPGHGGAALSNAFPFDPAVPPCAGPVLYGTPKTTSQGTLPALAYQGRPSLSIDDLQITLDGGVPDQHGLLLSSSADAATPFMGGTLLLDRPLRREQRFQFDFVGGVALFLHVTPELVGTTRYYQVWFQDPADPYGVGLSNGLRVNYCP